VLFTIVPRDTLGTVIHRNPGWALMGTTHPGPKGGRALDQDEKYKFPVCLVASGYWGIGAIGAIG